jgi:hypothetical protein
MRTSVADLLILAGIALVGVGLWHFSPSIALMAAGGAMAAGGLLFWRDGDDGGSK